MSKRRVSPVYPEFNDSEVACTGNFKPVVLPAQLPLLSQEARACIHSFAVAMGVPANRVVSEAILCWWENEGAYRMLQRQSN
jgi:hypothetical protein